MFGKSSITAVLASASIFSTGAALRADPDQARVLVFPLHPIHLTQDTDWVPQSVDENVVDALDRSEAYIAIPYSGALVVQDNNAAARNARQSNFPLAVRGTIQVVDTQVRLTAQLVDSHDGSALRTAIATGPVSDLLKVEDDLTAQLLGQKDNAPAAAAAGPAAPSSQAPVQIFIQNTPPVPTAQPYNYAANPYEGYPVDYFGGFGGFAGYPGVIITTPGNGFDHHHDHDHDHDHGDGHGGGGGGIVFTPGTPEVGTNTPGGPAFEPGVIGEPAAPLPVPPHTTPAPPPTPRFHIDNPAPPAAPLTSGGATPSDHHR